jgi:hypothetical protein
MEKIWLDSLMASASRALKSLTDEVAAATVGGWLALSETGSLASQMLLLFSWPS